MPFKSCYFSRLSVKRNLSSSSRTTLKKPLVLFSSKVLSSTSRDHMLIPSAQPQSYSCFRQEQTLSPTYSTSPRKPKSIQLNSKLSHWGRDKVISQRNSSSQAEEQAIGFVSRTAIWLSHGSQNWSEFRNYKWRPISIQAIDFGSPQCQPTDSQSPSFKVESNSPTNPPRDSRRTSIVLSMNLRNLNIILAPKHKSSRNYCSHLLSSMPLFSREGSLVQSVGISHTNG